MKIKVRESREVEVDIKVPSYLQNDTRFYFIMDEKKCICVNTYDDHLAIDKTFPSIINFDKAQEITKEIFQLAFESVLQKLCTIVNHKL